MIALRSVKIENIPDKSSVASACFRHLSHILLLIFHLESCFICILDNVFGHIIMFSLVVLLEMKEPIGLGSHSTFERQWGWVRSTFYAMLVTAFVLLSSWDLSDKKSFSHTLNGMSQIYERLQFFCRVEWYDSLTVVSISMQLLF